MGAREGRELYESFSDSMRSLIDIGYATLHLAHAMPHWPDPRAKNAACCCSCLPHMMEFHMEDEIHVNLDCHNVMDLQRNLKDWETLRSKVGKRTELFQIFRGKGRDGRMTGSVGCSCPPPSFV